MGTRQNTHSLQRLLESKIQTNDNALISSKIHNQPQNKFLLKNDIFKINNVNMDSEIGEFIGQKNTIFANKTQSIVRESSVITKTVVRKKKIMVNGELVETQEEEVEETEPNHREFHSQSQSFYANDDVFQGKPNMDTEKWKLNSLSNKKFPELPQSKFSSNFPSKLDANSIFNKSNLLENSNISFQTNTRTTERMMAFQSSINGKMNPSIIAMEKMKFVDGNPVEDTKILTIDNHENNPSIENGKRTKLKALKGSEEGEGKINKILNKIGLSKKKDECVMKDNERVSRIIDELIQTEINYIKDLSMVVEEYMTELCRRDAPKELAQNKYSLFGNIEHIYMFHDVQFLTDLKETERTPSCIADCFLKHAKEFALYRHYNRNKPFTDQSLVKYENFFREKQQKLNDMQTLGSYLIKPIQRIARYILLLKEISKECKKHKVSIKEVNDAIQMLETEIKFGMDLMALDALKELPENMDIKAYGDLIYRDKFNVTPPQGSKYEAMVFLFKDIIIISDVRLENNVDKHYYKDSILLSEVGLTECSNDSKVFKIWYHNHKKKNYTLQTKPEIKKLWVEIIKEQLQKELDNKIKEQNNRKSMDGAKLIDLSKQKFVDKEVNKKK